MLVKDAIKNLSRMNPDEPIIMAWWEAEAFGMDKESEEWEVLVDKVEDNMDWSQSHETMQDIKDIAE